MARSDPLFLGDLLSRQDWLNGSYQNENSEHRFTEAENVQKNTFCFQAASSCGQPDKLVIVVLLSSHVVIYNERIQFDIDQGKDY